jgi:hypothetical protein
MRFKALATGLVLGAVAFGGARASTNLLVNGSFETGDFTGWSLSGNTDLTTVQGRVNGTDPEDGNFQVVTGALGSLNFISQTFSDVLGATYEVSLWEASEGGSPSEFKVAINGTTFTDISPLPMSGYAQFTFVFAGTGSDTLSIGNRNDPSFSFIDNVSVTSVAGAVPEPSTWALFLLGFVGVGVAAFRKRRRTGALTALRDPAWFYERLSVDDRQSLVSAAAIIVSAKAFQRQARRKRRTSSQPLLGAGLRTDPRHSAKSLRAGRAGARRKSR